MPFQYFFSVLYCEFKNINHKYLIINFMLAEDSVVLISFQCQYRIPNVIFAHIN